MKRLLLVTICVVGCVHKPPVLTGQSPTCDIVCNHVENELKCSVETLNQANCMRICDNLFTSEQYTILNCWMESHNPNGCDQLDTCDEQ